MGDRDPAPSARVASPSLLERGETPQARTAPVRATQPGRGTGGQAVHRLRRQEATGVAATILAGLTRALRIACLRRLLPLGPATGNVSA